MVAHNKHGIVIVRHEEKPIEPPKVENFETHIDLIEREKPRSTRVIEALIIALVCGAISAAVGEIIQLMQTYG